MPKKNYLRAMNPICYNSFVLALLFLLQPIVCLSQNGSEQGYCFAKVNMNN